MKAQVRESLRENACEARRGGFGGNNKEKSVCYQSVNGELVGVYVLTSHWRLTALAHACASLRFLYGSAAQRK